MSSSKRKQGQGGGINTLLAFPFVIGGAGFQKSMNKQTNDRRETCQIHISPPRFWWRPPKGWQTHLTANGNLMPPRQHHAPGYNNVQPLLKIYACVYSTYLSVLRVPSLNGHDLRGVYFYSYRLDCGCLRRFVGWQTTGNSVQSRTPLFFFSFFFLFLFRFTYTHNCERTLLGCLPVSFFFAVSSQEKRAENVQGRLGLFVTHNGGRNRSFSSSFFTLFCCVINIFFVFFFFGVCCTSDIRWMSLLHDADGIHPSCAAQIK